MSTPISAPGLPVDEGAERLVELAIADAMRSSANMFCGPDGLPPTTDGIGLYVAVTQKSGLAGRIEARRPCANAGGLTHAEERYALLSTAGRADAAREARDDEALAHWRAKATEARLAFAAALDGCPDCSQATS